MPRLSLLMEQLVKASSLDWSRDAMITVYGLRRWGWRIQGSPGLREAAVDLEDYLSENSEFDSTVAAYSDRDLPAMHPRPPRWVVYESSVEIGQWVINGSPGPVAPHSPPGDADGVIVRIDKAGDALRLVDGALALVPGGLVGAGYALASLGGAIGVAIEGGEGWSVHSDSSGPPAVTIKRGGINGVCRGRIHVDSEVAGERIYPMVVAWSGDANDVAPVVIASLSEDTFGERGDSSLAVAVDLVMRLSVSGFDEPLRVAAMSHGSSTMIALRRWLARISSEALVLYDVPGEAFRITPPPPTYREARLGEAVYDTLRIGGHRVSVEPICPSWDYYSALAHGVPATCIGIPSGKERDAAAAIAAAVNAALRGYEATGAVWQELLLSAAELHAARSKADAVALMESLLGSAQGDAPPWLHEAPLEAESEGPIPSLAIAVKHRGEAAASAIDEVFGGLDPESSVVYAIQGLIPAMVASGHTLRSALAVTYALTGWRPKDPWAAAAALEVLGIVRLKN